MQQQPQRVEQDCLEQQQRLHGQQQQQWPLHAAAEKGDVDRVRRMLQSGLWDVSAQDAAGSTALQLACSDQSSSTDHATVVQLLLEHGACSNVFDDLQQTPLHIAATYARVSVVQLLLKHGAKVTPKNSMGWTPLTLAVRLGHSNVVQMMCNHVDSSTATLAAITAAVDAAVALDGAVPGSGIKNWEGLAQLLKAGGARGGLEWVTEQVGKLNIAELGPACAAVVQAWLKDTEPVTQQQEQVRAGKRDVVEIKLGLQQLLLSALAARKQHQQQQQEQQQQQQEEGDVW